MGEVVACRFFGGPADGKVWQCELSGAGIIIVPESSSLFAEHWQDDLDYDLGDHDAIARRREIANEMLDIYRRDTYPTTLVRTTEYRWDGTVSETGERRMRWSGRFN